MGQLFSSVFRCLGVEVKGDGADNRGLISHTQGLSYDITVASYPNDYMGLRQSFSPPIMFQSTCTHRLLRDAVTSLNDKQLFDVPSLESCTDPDIDHSDQHSSVAHNSSMSCLDQGTETTVYAEEIKAVLSEHEPTGEAKQVWGSEAESMTKVDVVSSGDIKGTISRETKLDERRIEPYTSLAGGRCYWLVKRSSPSLLVSEEAFSSTINLVTPSHNSKGSIGPYTSHQRILLVGEGDFSFSACLATALGSASNMVATSLNSQDFLIKNYGSFPTNQLKLKTRGSVLLHGIDATKMARNPHLAIMKFDRIIFNFPHSGFKRDSPESEIRRHQKLVSGFLRNAKKMIEDNGEIHVTHKSNPFFLKWDIPKLGTDQGLCLTQEVKFKRLKYPGYHTKYGFGGDKDFDCNPSKTYKFGLATKEKLITP